MSHPTRAISLAVLMIAAATTGTIAFTGLAAAATITVDPGGGGDYTTIQAAVDNANPGDTIEVEEGVYNESVVVTTSGITIEGDGPDKTVLDSDDGRLIALTVTGGADDVTIRELGVREYTLAVYVHAGAGTQSEAIALRENRFSDLGEIAVLVRANETGAVRGVTVEENEFDLDGALLGVHTLAEEGGTVEDLTYVDNELRDAADAAFALLTQNVSSLPRIDDVTIAENTVTNAHQGVSFVAANGTISNVSVAENAFTDGFQGIDVVGYDTGTYASIDITENEITDNDEGIIVRRGAEGDQIAVNGNTIAGNAAFGMGSRAVATVNAEHNDWGADSGPFDLQRNPAGEGDRTFGTVDFDPWVPTFVALENGAITPPDNNVTLQLVAHSDDVTGFEVEIEYDPAAVDAVTVGPGDAPFGAPTVETNDVEQGELELSGDTGGSPNPGSPVVLATVTFNGSLVTSPDGLAIGSRVFTDGDELKDAVFSVRDATLIGDVNADGAVDQQDVDDLDDYVDGPPRPAISRTRGDVNGDGSITDADVDLIRRMLEATAFEDVNHNGVFDPGVDERIPRSALADGRYDAKQHGLVITSGFGAITAEKIELKGTDITVGVDLEATDGKVRLDDKGESTLDLSGQTVTATKKIELKSKGDVVLTDSELAGREVKIDAKGEVEAENLEAEAEKKVELKADSAAHLAGSILEGDEVKAEAGSDLDASTGSLTATKKVELKADGTMTLDGATIDGGEEVKIEAKGSLGAADLQAAGTKKVELKADGAMTLDDGDLDGGELTLEATGSLSGVGLEANATDKLELEADGEVNVSQSVLDGGDELKIESKADLIARMATLVADDSIELEADGDIDLTGATLDAPEVETDAGGSVIGP